MNWFWMLFRRSERTDRMKLVEARTRARLAHEELMQVSEERATLLDGFFSGLKGKNDDDG